MEPSIGNRIELRQHQRQSVPGPCLLSYSQFALSSTVTVEAEGEGTVFKLSANVCKVESEAAVRVGEAMSLIILFPDQKCPTTVDLAMVRWAKGHAFGLEFISIGASEALRIRDFLVSVGPASS